MLKLGRQGGFGPLSYGHVISTWADADRSIIKCLVDFNLASLIFNFFCFVSTQINIKFL